MGTFITFITGLIIGSFLNVCIHRIPKRESVILPSSHCPFCGKNIKWYDNIPVLSYILLRGRCRSCGSGISFRYPVVEILSALIVSALYIKFGFVPGFFIYSAMACALIVVSFIDIDINEIPDGISLGGLIFGFTVSFLFPEIMETDNNFISLLLSILGAFTGGGSVYLMGLAGSALFKKEAMGGGDVKLMAMIGSIIGWKMALLTFFIAPFFGAGSGLFLKIRKGLDTMAYGPYLSISAMVSVFFGRDILRVIFYGV